MASSVRQRSRTPNPPTSSTAATADMATDEHREHDPTQEQEPLLGGPGDAVQQHETPLWKNLYLGTGVIAQAGILLLAVYVWFCVLTKPVILFATHPLLNSAGLLLVSEAILILQPTATQSQKIAGTYTHSTLNNVGVLALLAGLVLILYNKIKGGGTHLDSVHAVLGAVTYGLLVIQALVGFTAFFTPRLYGSVARAKGLYKYHRMSGYAVLVMMLATVAAATTTTYNVKVLKMNIWAVVVIALITLVGMVPRIRLHKLGF